MYTFISLFVHLYVVVALEALSSADILTKSISLVYFYRPDCRFCEDLSPTIDHLQDLYNHNHDFQVVKVNGWACQDLVNLFLVQAYPTLKLYDDTKKLVATYSGDRLVALIEEFIAENSEAKPDLSKSTSLVVSIVHKADLDYHLAKKPVLIAFVESHRPDWKQSRHRFHFYQTLARRHSEIVFATASITEVSSELLQFFKVSNSPSLVYYDGQKIGIYRTLNAIPEQSLEESHITLFLDSVEDGKEARAGLWFQSSEELHKYANLEKPDFQPEMKLGMNYIASPERDFTDDIESQYDQLVRKISL